jgi:hypothetical protein
MDSPPSTDRRKRSDVVNKIAKASFWAASVTGIAAVAAVLIVYPRRGHAAGWPLATTTASLSETAPPAPHAPRPLPAFVPVHSVSAPSDTAPAPAPTAETVKDANEYADRIAQSPAFQAFARKESLEPKLQGEVAHILAYYYMDESSILATQADLNKVASMRRQLRQHMDVRIRAKLPKSSWTDFEDTELLPSVEPQQPAAK